MIKSYKYKIRRPAKRIVATFEDWLEINRELYNAALQERRDAWRLNRVSVNYYSQSAQVKEIRAIREDVAAVYCQVLHKNLNRLDRAFENFFRRVKAGKKPGLPRFKTRTRFNTFTFPQKGFQLEGDTLYLSKIGKVRLHLSRPVEGTIKTCTIKREADGWYVIFAVDNVPARELEKTGATIGLDVGLENFATLSNGETIAIPRCLKQAERSLKTAQRAVSRKKRGGQNRKKAVKLLAKQHLKVRRQRRDFAHKTSLDLLRQYDEIAVEDLRIENLTRKPSPRQNGEGKYLPNGARAKAGLNKAITDAAWGNFLNILTCKAEEAGKRVWKVPAPYTSQECSGCGHRMKKTLTEREHRCSECGLKLHRDVNAAINIKARAVPLGMSAVGLANEPRISSYTC